MFFSLGLLLAASSADQASTPYVVRTDPVTGQKTIGPPPYPTAELMLPAVRQAQPRYPLMNVFSRDDYPAGAKGRGTVGIHLSVDPKGRVMNCRIVQSSGDAILDAASCALLRRRANFNPAVDREGRPTIGDVDTSVDWKAIFRKS